MNLNERYKIRNRKRLTRFLLFYSFLALFLFFYVSLARYSAIAENTSTIEIANWNILINNIDVEEETLTNIVALIPDIEDGNETTTDNKLAPGKRGHFDIVINPEKTEVSIDYEISFECGNLPTGIELTTYDIKEDNITGQTMQNNLIEGTINLDSTDQVLNADDSKTITVYWEWKESDEDIFPTGEEKYTISSTITVKQKISE